MIDQVPKVADKLNLSEVVRRATAAGLSYGEWVARHDPPGALVRKIPVAGLPRETLRHQKAVRGNNGCAVLITWEDGRKEEYPSISSAAMCLGVAPDTLRHRLKNEVRPHKRFAFSVSYADPAAARSTKRSILAISPEGVRAVYSGLCTAAKAVRTSAKTIKASCLTGQPTARGWRFEYTEG